MRSAQTLSAPVAAVPADDLLALRALRGQLLAARTSAAVMRHPATPPVSRDLATAAYVRAADLILDRLAALERSGALAKLEAALAPGGEAAA